MNPPPPFIGRARVVRWTVIDSRHRPTGNTLQIVDGVLQGPAAALAICQCEGEEAYYLFGCDQAWNSITDTWHMTLDEALRQAEHEYEGVSNTWHVG